MADKPQTSASTVAGDYLREQLGTVTTFNQCLETMADALDAEAAGAEPQRSRATEAPKPR